MPITGLKADSRRLGFKKKSAGPWDDGEPEVEGGTGKCGHYDEELDKFGYCRDEDCRRDRLINALHTGEAMRTKDGTILWTPGTILRKIK